MNPGANLSGVLAGVLAMGIWLGSAGVQAQSEIATDFGLASPGPTSRAEQVVVWHGDPIEIVLSPGQERRIEFDSAVEIGLEPRQADQFVIEIYDRTVLITPNPSATDTRVVVGQLSGTLRFPLDLKLIDQPIPLGPVRVIAQGAGGKEDPPSGTAVHTTTAPWGPARARTGYIDLVRFAAQQFYSPERLVDVPTGAKPVAVTGRPVRLVRYRSVKTIPLASWQVDRQFVTAVLVRNTLDDRVTLDPRHLVGRWLASTFYHHRLAPAGTRGDRSMAFLVSAIPFENALGLRVPQAGRVEPIQAALGGRQ